MFITRIEPCKGKRYKVYSDHEFLFALYGKEIKQYHIVENFDISDDLIMEILEHIVYNRAKERALYLLEIHPYTSFMMREKLKNNDYPVEIIDRVMIFLQKYHYIDDESYIRMYVDTYSKNKSKRQIQFDLERKGVAREQITDYLSVKNYSEEECLKKQFQRYIRGKDMSDFKIRKKVFRYFCGKGFSFELVKECMNMEETN